MLNESQNNSSYWKNKLEALDNLPEETLNKPAMWAKLHERLQENRSRKKAVWYSAAAACLILIFFISWLFIGNKETSLVENNRRQKPQGSSRTPEKLTDSMVVISKQIQTDKKHLVINKAINKKRQIPATDHVAADDIVVTGPNVIAVPEPKYNSSYKPDTIAIIAALPVKKKLRVVHVNELGKPMEEQTEFVRNNLAPVFQTEPLAGNVFSRFIVTRNASDNILKIKLSPSN